MCTAAERKFQRVQLSISCQGVLTLPLPGGCDWVVLNGLVVYYPVGERLWDIVSLLRLGLDYIKPSSGIH